MSNYEQRVSQRGQWSPRQLKWLQQLAGKAVTFFYVKSRGRIGARARGMPVLLLTTTGRRSGLARTVPLIFLRVGAAYVVTASAAGVSSNPGWYHNLLTEPNAAVQVGSSRWNVRARFAGEDERKRLYGEFKRSNRAFVRFEEKVQRVIPVVVLEPVQTESSPI